MYISVQCPPLAASLPWISVLSLSQSVGLCLCLLRLLCSGLLLVRCAPVLWSRAYLILIPFFSYPSAWQSLSPLPCPLVVPRTSFLPVSRQANDLEMSKYRTIRVYAMIGIKRIYLVC